MNGIPDDIAANLAMIDELGGPKTYNHYPNGWAMAFNTPFKMWKRYEFNGGTADPCVISWPAGIKAQGRDPGAVPPRDRPRADGPRRPGRQPSGDDQGLHPEPLRRREHALQLRRRRRRRATDRRSSTRCSARAGIWHDGWKAVTTHPTIARLEQLQRRRVGALPHRGRPLRAAQPRRRASGEGPRDGEPLVSPRPAPTRASRSTTARRWRSSSPSGRSSRRRATGTSTSRTTPRFPRPRRWSIRGRSFVIGAVVDLPGPRRARGAVLPGLALRRSRALRQGQPAALRRTASSACSSRRSSATEELPTGKNLILSASFEKDGEDPPPVATGILSLYYGDKKVGEGRIKTQPGGYMIAGEGLAVGRDVGDPVTQDYPGERPYRFTGGTINRVAVDVSGEPYIDMEREAAGHADARVTADWPKSSPTPRGRLALRRDQPDRRRRVACAQVRRRPGRCSGSRGGPSTCRSPGAGAPPGDSDGNSWARTGESRPLAPCVEIAHPVGPRCSSDPARPSSG